MIPPVVQPGDVFQRVRMPNDAGVANEVIKVASVSGGLVQLEWADASDMRTLMQAVSYASQSLSDEQKTQARSNIGVDGVNTVSLVQKSANSGGTWGPMDGSAMAFLGDTAYLIGGWYGDIANDDWSGNITTNLVYRTTDFGVTWTKIKDHDLTPDSTHFPPAHTMAFCVHRVSGTDYIYLFCGDLTDNWGDVYRSSNGSTWAKVNSTTTAYDGTCLMAAGSFGGNLYLAGGLTTPNTADHKRVVYKSTDNGATWTSLGNAPWSARVCNDRLVEHDGKLWLIGGGVYDDTLGRQYFNDVWSFDGTTWTQVLANGHSQWAGRFYANTFALGGWMYISRGTVSPGENIANTFRSRDGVTWFPVDVTLIASHADALATHATGALIGPGNGHLLNNVNTNSPTYLLRIDGSDIASGVQSLVNSAVQSVADDLAELEENPVSTFDTITIGTFLVSEDSEQILIGEDATGFYVCGGNGDNPKAVYIGTDTTEFTQLKGPVRLSNVASAGRQNSELFLLPSLNQPATKGTWYSNAFRAYDFTYLTWGQFGWEVSNADVEIWNGYEGDDTYGGWKFVSGAAKAIRAFLSGLGKLILNNTIVFAPESSTTLATNGQMTFERVSNTEVRVKLRGSDGTSRSVTLTLS